MNELENKKEYEMPYLLSPEIAEDKIDAEIAELKKIIAENSGNTIQAESPEKRRLAYPVKKQSYAYFGVIYFNIDADGLDKIKKSLFLNKKILRFLMLNATIKPRPKNENPKSEKLNPITVQSETSAPAQSFDQKLEDILNR